MFKSNASYLQPKPKYSLQNSLKRRWDNLWLKDEVMCLKNETLA